MNKRQTFAAGMTKLLNGNFRYGGWFEDPNALPYGQYAEDSSYYVYGDDKPYAKPKSYIVRVVNSHKDFELEAAIERLFESLEIPYKKLTDEIIYFEKAYVLEWVFELIE